MRKDVLFFKIRTILTKSSGITEAILTKKKLKQLIKQKKIIRNLYVIECNLSRLGWHLKYHVGAIDYQKFMV